MPPSDPIRTAKRVYNQMVAQGDPLCRPAKDSELADPLGTVDGAGWLGPSIAGQRVLCLAAGGGRQSSLYAAAGAKVTVVDISDAMLELDRRVAAERGYSLRLIEGSMDDLSMLDVGEFDIVIHPVSTCYVTNVLTVYGQVARVCRPGGIYISQHKSPVSLQTATEPSPDGTYAILHRYYRDRSGGEPSPVPPPAETTRASRRLRESGAIEYLHRWETLIGGLCQAGFAITNFSEPLHAKPKAERGSFADRAAFVPPYVRIKAVRSGDPTASDDLPKPRSIWIPESS